MDPGLRIWDIASGKPLRRSKILPFGGHGSPTSRTAARSSPPARTARPWSGTSPTWPIAPVRAARREGARSPLVRSRLGRRPSGARASWSLSVGGRAVPPRPASPRRIQRAGQQPRSLAIAPRHRRAGACRRSPGRAALEELAKGEPAAPRNRRCRGRAAPTVSQEDSPPAGATTR